MREQTQRRRKTAEPAAAAGKCDGAGRAASSAAGASDAGQEGRRAAGALPAAHHRGRRAARAARHAALHAAHRRRNGVVHDAGDAARHRPVERLLGVDGHIHPRSRKSELLLIVIYDTWLAYLAQGLPAFIEIV